MAVRHAYPPSVGPSSINVVDCENKGTVRFLVEVMKCLDARLEEVPPTFR